MNRGPLLLPLLLLAAPAQAWSPQLNDLHEILTQLRKITFLNRSLTPESVGIIEHLEQRFGSPLQEQYTRFVNKVLFIRDPAVVGHRDFQHDVQDPGGSWTLPTLLKRIFHTLGTGAAAAEPGLQKLVDSDGGQFSNFNTSWKTVDPKRRLGALPLRLLAVVNRLDLGRVIVNPSKSFGAENCPAGKVCGGELHFVYAAPPRMNDGSPASGPYFTFILEFVLPPLTKADFKALTLCWINEYLRPDDDNSRNSFEDALENFFHYWSQGEHAVRIRVNPRSNGPSWNLSQYAITAQGFVPSPLNRQPVLQAPAGGAEGCVTGDWPLGKYLSSPDNRDGVLAGNYDFFASSATCPVKPPAACFAHLDPTMQNSLTLSSGTVPGDKVEAMRFALSLNSCAGCHGLETHSSDLDQKTQFDQVKYPSSPTEAAGLSRFLTGSTSGGEPSFFDSWTYRPNRASTCGSAARDVSAYSYNDLVRRFVFHIVVLALPTGISLPVTIPGISLPSEITAAASAALIATWDRSLNAAGLTAWQPH